MKNLSVKFNSLKLHFTIHSNAFLAFRQKIKLLMTILLKKHVEIHGNNQNFLSMSLTSRFRKSKASSSTKQQNQLHPSSLVNLQQPKCCNMLNSLLLILAMCTKLHRADFKHSNHFIMWSNDEMMCQIT